MANIPGGQIDPLTQSVYALSSAMFDPNIEYKRRIADSQIGVDQAQIGNYNANAAKLGSDTALNTQKFDGRANLGAALLRHTRQDGTLDPKGMPEIAALLSQGSGDGQTLGNLGDIFAQAELNAPGNERNALIRMGKMPDQNFAATMGESDHISGRDAAEALREAENVQVLQNTQSGINNRLDNDTSRFNNAADNRQSGVNNELTVSNAFNMNEADNRQSGLNNAADNTRAITTNTADNTRAIQTNAADNRQSGVNNQLDNDTSRFNNGTDNMRAMATNDADNKRAIETNKTDNIRAMAQTEADNIRALAANEADNTTSRYNNSMTNQTSILNNSADNAQKAAHEKDTLDKPLWSAFEGNDGSLFSYDTHSPTAPSLVPIEGGPAGGVNKVGAAKTTKPQKPVIITPKLLEDLDARVSDQFGHFDVGDQQLPADVEDRAAALFQEGDPASGLLPGNMVGAVSQAFGEMVDTSGGDHSIMGMGDSPDAVRKTGGAPAAAPAAAQVTKVINGVTYHQINGQWFSE